MIRKCTPLYLLMATLLSVVLLPSCVSVKGYQKKYMSDPEMDLAARKSEKLENNFQSYREGSSGANGGKTGGGCGCN